MAPEESNAEPAQGTKGTKADRRQARGTKAERRRARAAKGTKAERRRARAAGSTAGRGAGRKDKAARVAAPGAPAEDASADERLEQRLARIEEAVAEQARLNEELLERVNAALAGAAPKAASDDAD